MAALYEKLVSNIKTAAINKLSLDASSGRNVSGVTPYIEELVNTLDTTTTSTSGKKSYTDPITGNTYYYN